MNATADHGVNWTTTIPARTTANFPIQETLAIIERTGAERRAKLSERRVEQQQQTITEFKRLLVKFLIAKLWKWAKASFAKFHAEWAAIEQRVCLRLAIRRLVAVVSVPALPEWSVTTGKRSRNRRVAKMAKAHQSQSCISSGDLNRYNKSGRQLRLCVGPQSLAASAIYAGR